MEWVGDAFGVTTMPIKLYNIENEGKKEESVKGERVCVSVCV